MLERAAEGRNLLAKAGRAVPERTTRARNHPRPLGTSRLMGDLLEAGDPVGVEGGSGCRCTAQARRRRNRSKEPKPLSRIAEGSGTTSKFTADTPALLPFIVTTYWLGLNGARDIMTSPESTSS